MAYNRTSLACQFSIEELIERAHRPCGFYLITIPHLMSWKEIGIRHGKMIRSMVRDAHEKRLPKIAGVRVFEEGEKTGRPHAHWVMTPRLSQQAIQHYADLAGMGHVWLDVRPASKYLGIYLGKYLSKQKKLPGVRRWSCFGWFDSSHKTKDIEIDTPETRVFRAAYERAKTEHQMEGREAYTYAVRAVNMWKYATHHEIAPEHEPYTYGDIEDNKILDGSGSVEARLPANG